MKAERLQRINIIGTSGAGKSTFARRLSNKLNHQYIELDSLFWKPHWKESSDQEFHQKIELALAPKSWVLDGNYQKSEKLKWKYVQTVIWIDYSYHRVIYQATKRAFFRILTKKELWPNTNNRESFAKTFLSKDSIIYWTLTTYHKNKKRYESIMNNPEYSHIHFVRIKNPKEAENFLNNIP